MSGVFGVPTLEYFPYYFFAFLSPLILFAMGLTGWGITEKRAGVGEGRPAAAADD
jgi:NhaC family Na+:H+ antiporter